MSENCQDLECPAGIRVVDFTQLEAGPSCTEALAWLGAEVVKIENPTTGDPARRVLPGKADDPWYFHMFNANKRSLEIVKKLLEKADITVENMGPPRPLARVGRRRWRTADRRSAHGARSAS